MPLSDPLLAEPTFSSTSVVTKVADLVKYFLENENSGHDWEHIQRVWHNARQIAATEPQADACLVDLTALLHDVDDPKVTGLPGPHNFKNAVNFLTHSGAPGHVIAQVCDSLKGIGYRTSLSGNGPQTWEQKIVSDADRLDAMGAIGIARCFVFTGKSGRPMFAPDQIPRVYLDAAAYADGSRADNTGINHFFDKLLRLKDSMATRTGRRMALARHKTMIRFLKEFFAEYGREDWRERLDYFLETKSAQVDAP